MLVTLAKLAVSSSAWTYHIFVTSSIPCTPFAPVTGGNSLTPLFLFWQEETAAVCSDDVEGKDDGEKARMLSYPLSDLTS